MRTSLLFSLALLVFISCSDANHDEISFIASDEDCKQEETSSKIIHMFDDDITVLDSAGYYKFHDDIWIPKEYLNDTQEVSTRGAAILGRTWPENKVYFTTEGIPNKYVNNIYEAIHIVEQHFIYRFHSYKRWCWILKI